MLKDIPNVTGLIDEIHLWTLSQMLLDLQMRYIYGLVLSHIVMLMDIPNVTGLIHDIHYGLYPKCYWTYT